jgi:hypothetical protein
MLRTATVERAILELLKTLMRDEMLKQFSLVGGTALALYMGHRKSIDLDLFSHRIFDVNLLETHLYETYGFRNKVYEQKPKLLLSGFINDIKVDCVWNDSVQVKPAHSYDNIRMDSIDDIAAMKLKAILQSGKRLKDFVDIAFLSTKISLTAMLDIFDKKYPSTSKILAIKVLSYFDDIDFSTGVELMTGTFNWNLIEKRIQEMIKYPEKIFDQAPITGHVRK